MFDTFISYRRAGGSEVASRLYDFLRFKGFNPFYDITGMENGRFDEQLKARLIQSENYVLILSKNALDRCNEEGDWVRIEIATAIEYNLNIVVLEEEGFEYPKSLPDNIVAIKNYNVMFYSFQNLSNRLEELPSQLKLPVNEFAQMENVSLIGKPKISGKYITQYEDDYRGRIVIRKAPAELHKFGNRIWGETTFGGDHKWRMSARIYAKKRIAGIYRARGYLDNGFGTFYLELMPNGILDGYWSGYDNENNKVTTGRYLFRRISDDYSVRSAKVSDFGTITKIADEELGKDYITEDFLREILDEKESTFCVVAFNKKSNKVVGFGIGKKAEYEDILDITRSREIKELKFEKEIGFLKTIAVDNQHQKLGIGSMIVEKMMAILKEEGICSFISTAWKHAGIINIASVLEKHGFYNVLELPNYWYESSIKEGFMCPMCGNPCHCSCVIYIKI